MALSENGLKLLDIAVKGVAGVAITAVVSIWGEKVTTAQQRFAEDRKALQATVELTSKQKDQDVELGMKMFGALVDHFFQKPTGQGGTARPEDLVLLRLVAFNFQDVPINLAPLYQYFEQHLTTDHEKKQLRDIAQEVARRQAFRLTVKNGFDSGPLRIKKGEKHRFGNILTTVIIEDVGEDSVRASIVSDTNPEHAIGPFTVTYFAIPILDNTKIEEQRFSVLLHHIQGEEAEIRFIAFPEHLAEDRFDVAEMSRIFRDK